MTYLVQIGDTISDQWKTIAATDRKDAALKLLRKQPNPFCLFPCTVYVSLGDMRHENGAPMAVEAFKVERKL